MHINGIEKILPDLLIFANNHILDQGEGLYSTLRVLEDNNINYVGAGSNLHEAARPYVLEQNGICIGVYACAEHEFTIASENSVGANPFDSLENLDHISCLKNSCDYVIVSTIAAKSIIVISVLTCRGYAVRLLIKARFSSMSAQPLYWRI